MTINGHYESSSWFQPDRYCEIKTFNPNKMLRFDQNPETAGDPGKFFFVITLPVFWAFSAMFSFSHPGDEYGIFVVSALAGSWVCYVLPHVDAVRDVLWIILLAGGGILAGLGFVMDRLQVSRRIWVILFCMFIPVILAVSLMAYPSFDAAIAKNGSIWAYLAGSLCIGLYGSAILSTALKAVPAISRCIRFKGAGGSRP